MSKDYDYQNFELVFNDTPSEGLRQTVTEELSLALVDGDISSEVGDPAIVLENITTRGENLDNILHKYAAFFHDTGAIEWQGDGEIGFVKIQDGRLFITQAEIVPGPWWPFDDR